jgi:hypothetical protein
LSNCRIEETMMMFWSRSGLSLIANNDTGTF